MARLTLILKVLMIERHLRVIDVFRSQDDLMMDNVSLPLFALLAKATVDLDAILNE